MLMNIINMINCRVVNENQDNVFKTLFNNKVFWIIFVIELAAQNAMIFATELTEGTPFKFLPPLFGTIDLNWKHHLTAWIFGLFPLALRPLTNKIPVTSFHFMDSIDLETKHGANCVTRWAERAESDFKRATSEQTGSDQQPGEGAAADKTAPDVAKPPATAQGKATASPK
jgi:hypothetical protein